MMDKLRSNWLALTFLGGVIASVGGTSITAYQWGFHLELEVAANTSDRQLKRFQVLEERAKGRPLSPRERVEFCGLASALKIGGPVVQRVCQ